MLIHSASQIPHPCRRSPARTCLGDSGIIENGAVLIRGETIIETGTSRELLRKYPDEETFDAQGKVVMPGFVDPHTHLVWAGDRAAEFEMRLQGKTYMEIMAAGGGIAATMSATRAGVSQMNCWHRPANGRRSMFRTAPQPRKPRPVTDWNSTQNWHNWRCC